MAVEARCTVAKMILTIIFAIVSHQVLGAPTHLGQPSEQHVVLSLQSGPGGVCTLTGFPQSFFRLSSTGTMSASAFVVPLKKRLVITDVQWTVSPFDEPFVAGRDLYLGIFANFSPGGQAQEKVFLSHPVHIPVDNASALLGGSDNLIAGFMVGAGGSLCPFVTTSTPTFSGVIHAPSEVFLYGYLVD